MGRIMFPKKNIEALALILKNTERAYMYGAYGREQWLSVILFLRKEYGFSDKTIEAILLSRWMRWASEAHGKANLSGFKKFIKSNYFKTRKSFVEQSAQLTKEMFPDA